MKALATISALALATAAPSLAEEDAESVEYALAECIYEKDPALLIAIRDAASEQEFIDAFRKGVETCEYPEQEYSMGRFFNAVNELAGPPEYSDDA